MICYYHPEQEAVGTCAVCNKALCKNCFDLTVGHWCYDCAKAAHDNAKKSLISSIIWAVLSIVAAVVGFILIANLSANDSVWYYIGGLLIILGCFVPAWKFLGRVADALFGERIYVGMVLILVIIFKILLAIFVSIFVPIIYIILVIKNIVKYNNLKKDMSTIEAAHQSFVNVD